MRIYVEGAPRGFFYMLESVLWTLDLSRKDCVLFYDGRFVMLAFEEMINRGGFGWFRKGRRDFTARCIIFIRQPGFDL